MDFYCRVRAVCALPPFSLSYKGTTSSGGDVYTMLSRKEERDCAQARLLFIAKMRFSREDFSVSSAELSCKGQKLF